MNTRDIVSPPPTLGDVILTACCCQFLVLLGIAAIVLAVLAWKGVW